MLSRFTGDEGRRNLLYALAEQKLVRGSKALAEALASRVVVLEAQTGGAIIHQGGVDNDVFLIVTGSFDVFVNGKRVARRQAGEHVGEMAAVQPTQIRSATVVAAEPSVVARISAAALDDLSQEYPEIHRYVAQELARRLYQRNDHVGSARERINVLLLATQRGQEVAKVVQQTLTSEGFAIRVWDGGFARTGGSQIQKLQEMAAGVDFALIVVSGVGETLNGEGGWPLARDELMMETGVLLGVLGGDRIVLLEEARGDTLSSRALPGVTDMPWHAREGEDLEVALTSTCTRLRRYFETHGPYVVE